MMDLSGHNHFISPGETEEGEKEREEGIEGGGLS